MKILVAGAGGMLGGAVVETAQAKGHVVISVGRQRLDVTNIAAISALIAETAPDVLINCAADTDVEAAEADDNRAFTVNAVLPGVLAMLCRRNNIRLVHYSSTGCYGSWKDDPYSDFDPLSPTTAHHRSKAAGELAIRNAGADSLIVRTGWLYGGSPDHPKNFVWKRLLEAQGKNYILSDNSQRGNPTFVGDVAIQTLNLLDVGLSGVINCVAAGTAMRIDYVSQILQAAGLNCEVRAAPPGHFNRQAKVSHNESAINRRLRLLGLDIMPDWRQSLIHFVNTLIPHLPQNGAYASAARSKP